VNSLVEQMIDHRALAGLASSDFGWLKAHHHFPIDGRRDPAHAPIRSLYVWNDDEFAPGHGFPLHCHRDVEIITYVRTGAVTHEDTLGNSYEIRAGNVQVMSAGSGLRHSEYNRGRQPLKIFQIWLAPNRLGARPSYATRRFPGGEQSNCLTILASGLAEDAQSDALPLRADARVLAGRLEIGKSMGYEIKGGRDVYLVPALGTVSVNGVRIEEGDGVAITEETMLECKGLADSKLVVVELD
jgi:redox-sensitive bicupin YhaK (pirin superfamily)